VPAPEPVAVVAVVEVVKEVEVVEEEKLSTGSIIGIAVGGAVGVALLVLLFMCLFCGAGGCLYKKYGKAKAKPINLQMVHNTNGGPEQLPQLEDNEEESVTRGKSG